AVPDQFNYGDVFAAVGYDKIHHYDNAGNFIEELDTVTGGDYITGMAFDTAGNLYATCFSTDQVIVFDKMGNLVGPFGSGYNSHPESAVFNSAGDIFVGHADGTADIRQLNSGGTFVDSYNVAVEDRGSDWIDLAADQKTMFYTSEGYDIFRYDLSTKTQLPKFVTLPERPAFALRVLSDGGVIVAATGHCYRLNNAGAIAQTYPRPPGETTPLFALNLDPDGTSFWTAGYYSGKVYKIDLATGNVLVTINTNDHGEVSALAGLAVYGEKTALGSISGMKFNDLNGNGVKDPGEPGLANWEIRLMEAAGGTRSTLTDVNGNYFFNLLEDGIYTVSEVNKPGWVQTAPQPVPPGTYTVTIDGGLDVDGRDFGNKEGVENDAMLYFSPRFDMTLMNNWYYFWLRDADLASYADMGSNFKFEFDGTPYGMRNLDAVDVYMPYQTSEEEESVKIYFSVREDHLLSNKDGSPFYMHKEDIAVLDVEAQHFERILDGKSVGILGIDALAVLEYEGENSNDHCFVFSPTVNCLCSGGTNPPFYCHEQDLVKYDPMAGSFEIWLRGSDIGVNTLDGVDIMGGKVYFSVKEPIYIYKPPFISVYLKDGDVGVYDMCTQGVELYFEGKPKGVFSIDALSLNMDYPGRLIRIDRPRNYVEPSGFGLAGQGSISR
ncbi:MAG: SdrD B-like domain-containing protein, partial [Planctomycetota bacterium]